VARLESAAGAAAAVVAGEVSVVDVCWSVRDRRVDAAGLADGELVAADVRGYGSGVARVEERVTTDLRTWAACTMWVGAWWPGYEHRWLAAHAVD